MGLFGSSEETNNEKTVDTAGNVNNNIVIQQQEVKDLHNQLMLNQKMLIAAYLLVFFYTQFRKSMKKRYADKPKPDSQLIVIMAIKIKHQRIKESENIHKFCAQNILKR